jgi:precorrin-2/cobalt-factor-2 C20-methyltransferase
MSAADAQFIGVGVGPGDPGLITLKAADYIRSADLICYIEGSEGNSQARQIASALLDEARDGQRELAILMPMSEERSAANRVYDEAACEIQQAIDADQRVVFLCEGDPLFFGSFAYLLARLAHNRCEVVPGIGSVNAASSALRLPLAILNESCTVVTGRHPDEVLLNALQNHDSVVIMKAGRARPRILAALRQTGRLADAAYCEYLGRDNEFIEFDVEQLADEPGPYFSLFVVTRSERSHR